jgi:hypothetical protein
LRDREQARHGRSAYVVTICRFATSAAEAMKSGRGALRGVLMPEVLSALTCLTSRKPPPRSPDLL